ncbi:MAG: hypothetical protein ACT4P7_06145 [Gemmatimonadaceae bacterium]
MSKLHFGIPGVLGALILLVWAIGWIFLELRDGLYHLLVPIGAVLILSQVVRRIAAH